MDVGKVGERGHKSCSYSPEMLIMQCNVDDTVDNHKLNATMHFFTDVQCILYEISI